MASFLITAGHLPKSVLPVFLFAYSSGLAEYSERISILHICTDPEDSSVIQTVNDLNQISSAVSADFPYWQTRFDYRYWQPDLRINIDPEDSLSVRLLTDALYGQETQKNTPDDTASVQWRMTSLLHSGAAEWSDLFTSIRNIIKDTDEKIRIMIAADLADSEGAGIAFALASFLRKSFSGEERLVLAFSFLNNITGTDDPTLRLRIKENLRTISENRLIRESATSDRSVADCAWIFGMPAGCRVADPEGSPVNAAFARVCATFFSAENRSFGCRTVSIPDALTWSVFGRSAPTFAAFVRMAIWILTDLNPAIDEFRGRSSVMTALSPSPRTAFFRRFFQPALQDEHADLTEQLTTLQRILKQFLTHLCAFVRFLPDILRSSTVNSEVWSRLVSLCGQCVTLGSAWDVAMKSAREAGLDKVRPVHRISMDDTEEEKAQKELKDKEDRLAQALKKRQEVMDTAGGFRSAQALADCLSRCENALSMAIAQLNGLHDSDHEKMLLAQNRVETLKAAVERTRSDLKQAVAFPALSAMPSPRISLTAPWSSELFDSESLHLLFDYLSAGSSSDDELTRRVRDSLHTLIPDQNDNDSRLFMREFITVYQDLNGQPFSCLLEAAAAVFSDHTTVPRSTAGDVPFVQLIPDTDHSGTITSLDSMLEHIVAPSSVDRTASRRGLLAMLLLIQYRRGTAESARITRRKLRPADSPDIAAWLDTVSSPSAEIIYLHKGMDEFPVAVILPRNDLFTVPLTVRQASLIPGFVLWFSPLTRMFSDPCAYLNESDRILLTEQLTRLRSLIDPSGSPLLNEFLSSFQRSVMHIARKQSGIDPVFENRLTAVCGLSGLQAFRDLVRHEVIYEKDIKNDLICACLTGEDQVPGPVSKVSKEINYSWKGIPFARESSVHLLETVGFPDEDSALIPLTRDCETLFEASDTYRDELQKKIPLLLKRYPDCSDESRAKAIAVMNRAAAPIEDHVTELEYPIDQDSAVIESILSEALAPLDAASCREPFSSRLAVIPRQGRKVLGDSVLSDQCVLKSTESDDPELEIPDDAVIPPFSAAFAAMLCETAEGRTLMGSDLLTFTREGDSIRVSILLHASFDLRMTHLYSPDEIIHLYSDDIPTVAIWPAIPFERKDWKAYYSFGHMPGDFTLSALLDGKVVSLTHEGARYAQETAVCPACYILEQSGSSVGVLPNILPGPAIPSGSGMTACIDFGSSGVSVVLSSDEGPEPLTGSVTIRTLLRHPLHSRQVLRDEFLPAVPVTPILPSAARIFRNTLNQSPVPFVDGSILMPSSMEDLNDIDSHSLFTSLKWSSEKSRSSELCLHQVMLMTALQARLSGATSLSWRLAIPDEMAFDGKQTLAQHFSMLAETVSAESCLLPPDDIPMVSYASESTANGSYFRACAPEQTASGFMVLDIGSCSSDLSLFLRGHNEAIRACRLPLGIQYMLIPALLSDPSLLAKDFGAIQDESFKKDLAVITELFTAAQTDKVVLRKARLALDTFTADRLDLIRQYLYTVPGGCSSVRSGAMLLVHHAWLLSLSGLLLFQLSSDSSRNDSLPSRMTLFMSGRGAGIMESMSEITRRRLDPFLAICRSTHIHGVQVLYSTEKKLEIPVGLALQPAPSGTLPRPVVFPVAIPIKPLDLLSRFLLLFLQQFPNAALTLFPGWYTNDPYRPLTAKAMDSIDSAVSSCFSGKDIPRPFDSLAACLTFLLESARS